MDALLERAIDTALESLNNLERQARDVARRFRMRADADARQGLRELMAAAERVVTLAEASVDAAGTDLTTFCDARGLEAEAATASLMNELIRHQHTGNSIAIATTLERRFVAVVEEWRQLFFSLGDAPTDPSGHAA